MSDIDFWRMDADALLGTHTIDFYQSAAIMEFTLVAKGVIER
jgi:hypothetical protein